MKQTSVKSNSKRSKPIFRLLIWSKALRSENIFWREKLYFLQIVDVKNYNVLIDEIKCFGQPISNNIKTYESILKASTDQGDGYLASCLSEYPYFKKHYKIFK